MTSTAYKQDMPPPGGYGPVTYKRIPAKTYFRGRTIILGYLGITAGACAIYYYQLKYNTEKEVERRSAQLAMYPLLLAERDREFLKQLRRNRDEEAKLMANVPGWVVGTWYGEPVYKTLPPDTLVTPRFGEYYAHASEEEFAKRAFHNQWS